MSEIVLDGHKCLYHLDRIKDWLDGKRIAPISIDWALTQICNYNCVYCYAQMQQNPNKRKITKEIAFNFLDDAKDIGVKATSLVSDGESTLVPFFYDVVSHGKEIGLDMAVGTHGHNLKTEKLQELLSNLTYLRFNISAAEPERYGEIHGVPIDWYYETMDIIKECVKTKEENGLDITLGLQMVLMPDFWDQILPMAELGEELGVDYTIIKHCSDDELGTLGIDYDDYMPLYQHLEMAESYSTDKYLVKAKWSKIKTGRDRKYIQCYGPPLMLQTSGSGIIAPCGSFFNPKYKEYWIGDITKGDRLKELWQSDRYWKVMDKLATDFDARYECETLCMQHKVNEFLWDLKHPPQHVNFL